MWEGARGFSKQLSTDSHGFNLILILNSFPDFIKALVPNLLRT